jgi:glycosyltransferase involved in cell wall biosynthesis
LGPRFGEFLERKIFATADLLIANTEPAAERWRERFPEYPRKIQVLWNGFDPEDPIAASPLPDRPYRVLAYFGSTYVGRQPGKLLASVERLVASKQLDGSSIRIRLVGSPRSQVGDLPAALEKLGCVEIVDRIPRPEAQHLMATSDYLLLLDLEGHTEGLHVPAKIFEYLRVGRPILAYTCKNSAVERVLDRSGVPHVCVYQTDSDPKADRKVAAFLELSTEPVEMAPACREDFSAPSQAARLANWLCPNFTMPGEPQHVPLLDPCGNSK